MGTTAKETAPPRRILILLLVNLVFLWHSAKHSARRSAQIAPRRCHPKTSVSHTGHLYKPRRVLPQLRPSPKEVCTRRSQHHSDVHRPSLLTVNCWACFIPTGNTASKGKGGPIDQIVGEHKTTNTKSWPNQDRKHAKPPPCISCILARVTRGITDGAIRAPASSPIASSKPVPNRLRFLASPRVALISGLSGESARASARQQGTQPRRKARAPQPQPPAATVHAARHNAARQVCTAARHLPLTHSSSISQALCLAETNPLASIETTPSTSTETASTVINTPRSLPITAIVSFFAFPQWCTAGRPPKAAATAETERFA